MLRKIGVLYKDSIRQYKSLVDSITLIKEEKKLENDSTEDIVDIVKSIKNKKSLKKTSNE